MIIFFHCFVRDKDKIVSHNKSLWYVDTNCSINWKIPAKLHSVSNFVQFDVDNGQVYGVQVNMLVLTPFFALKGDGGGEHQNDYDMEYNYFYI